MLRNLNLEELLGPCHFPCTLQGKQSNIPKKESLKVTFNEANLSDNTMDAFCDVISKMTDTNRNYSNPHKLSYKPDMTGLI